MTVSRPNVVSTPRSPRPPGPRPASRPLGVPGHQSRPAAAGRGTGNVRHSLIVAAQCIVCHPRVVRREPARQGL